MPTLRRWGHFIDDYCAVHEGDNPYFYSERTNVGVLSAAAWGPGSGSVLEYACRRRGDGGDNAGWADLYVYDQHTSATIEAKQLFHGAGIDAAAINASFKTGNAQAVTNQDSDMALAAVFLTVKAPADTVSVDEVCGKALAAMEASAAQAWAWAFPLSKRTCLMTERRSDAAFFWPGVIVGLCLADENLG